MAGPITFPIYSLSFWKAYFIQMRPYLLFISGVAGVSGIAISATESTHIWQIFLAFLPFFLGYGFGQALTDCFQTDTDKLSAPYRPLSKGIISIRAVFVVSLIGLALSGILLFQLHPMNLWLCLLSVFGLVTYSYIKRNFWFAGPFYNAWIVVLLPIMGHFSMLTNPETHLEFFNYRYPLVTFFSYTNFVLMGYLKDIDADKATGYQTFPVVFGWDRTIIAGDFIGLTTLIMFWLPEVKNTFELVFGVCGTAAIIVGQIYAHLTHLKNEKGALIPILCTIRCFVLVHIAMTMRFQPRWWLYGILFYALFETAIYLRPSKYQV